MYWGANIAAQDIVSGEATPTDPTVPSLTPSLEFVLPTVDPASLYTPTVEVISPTLEVITPTADAATPTETPLVEAPTTVPTFTLDAVLPTESLETATATLAEIMPILTTEGTATNEATSTASLSPTLTATSAAPEPPMTLLLEETFESGTTYTWRLGAGWLIASDSVGQVLAVSNSSEPTTFAFDNLLNVALESRLLLESGMARFSIRQTADGAYSLLLDTNGQLALFWRDQLIGSSTLPTFDSTLWHTVRIAAVDGLVRVTIDGVEWFALPDVSTGLPGTVSFANAGGSMKVDDLRIFLSAVELAALTAKAQVTATPSPMPLPSFPQPTPEGLFTSLSSGGPNDCIRDNVSTHIDEEFAYIAPGDPDGICEAIEYSRVTPTAPLYPYPSYPIFLDSGTYTLQRTLVIHKSVAFIGRGVDITIITQVNNSNQMAGLVTINNNAAVNFTDFTFSGGLAINDTFGATQGGAIRMYSGYLSLVDMKFANNQASRFGGGNSNRRNCGCSRANNYE